MQALESLGKHLLTVIYNSRDFYKMKKHVPFYNQTRQQRNLKYIQTKNLIRKEFETKGRLFYSHHVINSKDGQEKESTNGFDWCDIYFMSKKHRHFYNVCLITTKTAAADILQDVICYSENNKIKMLKDTVKNERGCKPVEWTDDALAYFARRDAYQVNKLEELKDASLNVNVGETFDFQYVSGVGLYATLDVPELTEEVINQYISDFWDKGEVASIKKVVQIKVSDVKETVV